ncbi:M20/M25/M40 family metallo-hydrolase [bacterium]|nr:M20/M25/M40 family metallo-hydrolase [bacterium]
MQTVYDVEVLFTEMLEHFSNLIRINTTNPPGNEVEAVKYIARLFDLEKIPYQILEPSPGRASIIGRLKGDGSKKPLLLMSHLDVVGVETDKWQHPPFSGLVDDRFLWGRGTLDCKNTVVLWLMILFALKRSNFPLKRDLIFLGAADEETGGSQGARWIVQNHFDLVDAEAALNEGGGFAIEFAGKTFITYETAEKGNIWLRITRQGKSGHASVPTNNNPVTYIANLISRLQRQKQPFLVTNTVREMIVALSKCQPFPANILMRQILNPVLSDLVIKNGIKNETTANGIRAMVRNTLCPTIVSGGQKVNVIPSEVSTELDLRVLPGIDPEKVLSRIKESIGHENTVEITDFVHATESILDHPLAESIKKGVGLSNPETPVIPFMSPGSTDGGFFRSKGMVVYGFTPVLPVDDIALAHAHNEKISLETIKYSLKVGLDTVCDFSG